VAGAFTTAVAVTAAADTTIMAEAEAIRTGAEATAAADMAAADMAADTAESSDRGPRSDLDQPAGWLTI